jgi:hypothetical protein
VEIYLIGLNVLLLGVIAIILRGAIVMQNENKVLKGFSGSVLAFAAHVLETDAKSLETKYNAFIKDRACKKTTSN